MSVNVTHAIDGDRRRQLAELFGATWWAADRSRDDIDAILAGSSAVVGLVERPSGRLVGFARVITDRRVVALVLDVIIHPDWRGRGLGDHLMQVVLALPELTGVDSIELVCQPDLVDFYRRWGFTDSVNGSRLMRRSRNAKLVSGFPQ